MLRIVLLIGNIGLLVVSFFLIMGNTNDPIGIICFIILIILSSLNVYFIRGTYPGNISLYLKRKKLEEEIKIQEAENRLKEIQSQG